MKNVILNLGGGVYDLREMKKGKSEGGGIKKNQLGGSIKTKSCT